MRIARDTRIAPPPAALRGAGGLVAVPSLSPAELARAGRVLWLSGTWTMPGDSFSREAILAVTDNRATGPIHWTANRIPSVSGVEIVRGSITAVSLELDGVSAERGLACDQYRLALSGDNRRGTFTGTSRAFGSWSGRLRGVYRFRDETRSRT